jgi:hypothetical protein
MIYSERERGRSTFGRFGAGAATSVVTTLPPARPDQAPPTTGAAPSRNGKRAAGSFTGIEHCPQGELGGPRCQPYTVWYQGKIVRFCKTKGEAANVLAWEL